MPFTPLCSAGRRGVVERQLRAVGDRLRKAHGMSLSWETSLVGHLLSLWDSDLGGRSTRDAIEEGVVEALAEALDSRVGKGGVGEGGGGGGRGFVLEVISGEISCRTLVGEGEEESDNG